MNEYLIQHYTARKWWNHNPKTTSFATTWVDPEGIVLSEIRQTEKDKYCVISHACGIEENKNK